ncbi:MAG TPA: response regulator [Labilithrix sp.]|jgi:DNA-binding response OmpR family regulator
MSVVLLVEDHDEARAFYASALRAAGFEVIEAPTLHAAGATCETQRPDVIVLDRRLPDGDGLDFVRRVHRLTRPMPVVMLTASGQRSDVEAALVAGCDVFLTKPCPGDVLVLHVERVVGAAATRSA